MTQQQEADPGQRYAHTSADKNRKAGVVRVSLLIHEPHVMTFAVEVPLMGVHVRWSPPTSTPTSRLGLHSLRYLSGVGSLNRGDSVAPASQLGGRMSVSATCTTRIFESLGR